MILYFCMVCIRAVCNHVHTVISFMYVYQFHPDIRQISIKGHGLDQVQVHGLIICKAYLSILVCFYHTSLGHP